MKNRKINRLKWYDYSQNWYYFVTFCTNKREEIFWIIVDNKMILNQYGEIVKNQIKWLSMQYKYVFFDDVIIMPNHVHCILIINEEMFYPSVSMAWFSINLTEKIKPLYELIWALKTTSSKIIHNNGLKEFKWQRSFYDHIIQNTIALNNIRQYIQYNPQKWELEKDRNHLSNIFLSD